MAGNYSGLCRRCYGRVWKFTEQYCYDCRAKTDKLAQNYPRYKPCYKCHGVYHPSLEGCPKCELKQIPEEILKTMTALNKDRMSPKQCRVCGHYIRNGGAWGRNEDGTPQVTCITCNGIIHAFFKAEGVKYKCYPDPYILTEEEKKNMKVAVIKSCTETLCRICGGSSEGGSIYCQACIKIIEQIHKTIGIPASAEDIRKARKEQDMKKGTFECIKKEYAVNEAIQWIGQNDKVILGNLPHHFIRFEYGKSNGIAREKKLFCKYKDGEWFEVALNDYFVKDHNNRWKHWKKADFEKTFVTE